jgi:Domain of unknown function (DUF4189)
MSASPGSATVTVELGYPREEETEMRSIVLLAIGAAALASLVAGIRPAQAQYGAIAYDSANCAWGDSWNYANQAAANTRALADCKGDGCKIVAPIAPHFCGALASTANCKGWGAATRPTKDAALLAAMQDCQHYNTGQCTVRASDCNR